MEMTKVARPAKTHGLKTIWNRRTMAVSAVIEIGPSDIMPCFSINCAAALVSTVKRMNGIYFIILLPVPGMYLHARDAYSVKFAYLI
ncbi:hypothetical protein D3C78_1623830 [compost metagenome]